MSLQQDELEVLVGYLNRCDKQAIRRMEMQRARYVGGIHLGVGLSIHKMEFTQRMHGVIQGHKWYSGA